MNKPCGEPSNGVVDPMDDKPPSKADEPAPGRMRCVCGERVTLLVTGTPFVCNCGRRYEMTFDAEVAHNALERRVRELEDKVARIARAANGGQ